MKSIKERTYKFGGNDSDGILFIAPNPKKPRVSKNLIQDYHAIDYEAIKTHELAYIHENSRRAQDSGMLYDYIMNSISTVA